jgi:hypothetical protein
MKPKKPSLDVSLLSDVASLNPRVLTQIERRIRECLKQFPDVCEGKIMLNGVDHFFTYKVRRNLVEVNILERELAERTYP